MLTAYPPELPSRIPPATRSADWRFLLPLPDKGNVVLVGDNLGDAAYHFKQFNISLTLLDSTYGLADLAEAVSSPTDVFAVPYGIPLNSPMSDLGGLDYNALRQLIRPGGVLLVGFSNVYYKQRTGILSARPRYIQTLLRQARYSAIDLYGAYPDLITPEYIFPLKTSILSYVLHFHWQNKLPEMFLRILSAPLIVAGMANIFRYYFLVARV